MKKICFRFDIDTHVCMSKGMPNLLELAAEEGVLFTFFVNMGKGFDRFNSIKNIFGRLFRKSEQKKLANLSMFIKLGLKETISALFLNPSVGSNYGGVLKRASELGHELGLHGGRNHAHWEKLSHTWSYEKVSSEVIFGVEQFKQLNLPLPSSFASPAWRSPEHLIPILIENGFKICADIRDSSICDIFLKDGILQASTNILSPAEDVGYIESFRALGSDNKVILNDFESQIKRVNNLAMVYEHPFYAGVHEIELLREMIKIAKANGFQISTLNELYCATN